MEEKEQEQQQQQRSTSADDDQDQELPSFEGHSPIEEQNEHDQHQQMGCSNKPMFTPAVFKRRQITKHHVVQSPTDNIFSPISQKLLGKKRNDAARELQDI